MIIITVVLPAKIITQGRLRVNFPWLPFTILNQEQFVDHHLLYHLYLAPWMQWGGVMGVKIAQSLIIGAITLSFWTLLRYLKVSFSSIWTLGLLSISAPFLYRMLMIRTQAAAVLLLLLALHLLFRRRYIGLILLGFAYTWLYNGFILLPVLVMLYCVAVWVTERRLVWQPLVYVALGTGLGLFVNPYFPQNIQFILDHLSEKVDIATSVQVGSEWYPYTTADLMKNSFGMLLAFGLGIVANGLRKTNRDRIEMTLLLIVLMLFFMLFRSRRFIEYTPIFVLLFSAVAWGRIGIPWEDVLPTFLLRPSLRILRSFVLLLLIVFLAWGVLPQLEDDIRGAKGIQYLAGAAAWLETNTEPGEIIFQTDWDDFPYLFFHNRHNVYLVGLDPTYLQVADPFMWNQWVAITQGQVERPSVLIRETFGAGYVVSDLHHDAFAQQAENDPHLQLMYRDETSLIWQVIDTE